MFEKFRMVSGFLIIPTVVLYLFGFICITAYLSRFGIVNFDIINARYLIAGFYPLVFIAIVIHVAITLNNALVEKLPFGARRWRARYGFLLKLVGYPFAISFALSRAFDVVAEYTKPVQPTHIGFHPFFPKDHVGTWIDGHFPSCPSDCWLPIIIKNTGYIAAYGLLIVLSGFGIYFLARLVAAIRNRIWGSKNKVINSELATASVLKTDASLPAGQEKSSALREMIFAVLDVLGISVVLAILWWASSDISANIYDFNSFGDPEAGSFSAGLLFAWMFASICFLVIFLPQMSNQSGQFQFQLFANSIRNPLAIDTYMNGLIPILGALFAFGAVIFPRIPYAIGGGEPRPITLKTKTPDSLSESKKLYLLGESNQFLFVVDIEDTTNKAIQINKDIVAYIQTRSADTAVQPK